MAVTVADQQILAGAAATLTATWLDSTGEIDTSITSNVTVGVARADGTEVIANTQAATTEDGVSTVALDPADTAQLDWLTATWTHGPSEATITSVVEVVGGFYLSVAQARELEPGIADAGTYPDAEVRRVRAEVEDEFEAICGVAFVPRFHQVRYGSNPACHDLVLPYPRVRRIRSIIGPAGPWTNDQIGAVGLNALPGVLRARSGWTGPLTIAFEHGYDRPPPELVAAAALRIRHRLNRPVSGVPDRATSFSVTEAGTYRLDQAGRYKTGIPDVDAVLARRSERGPTIA